MTKHMTQGGNYHFHLCDLCGFSERGTQWTTFAPSVRKGPAWSADSSTSPVGWTAIYTPDPVYKGCSLQRDVCPHCVAAATASEVPLAAYAPPYRFKYKRGDLVYWVNQQGRRNGFRTITGCDRNVHGPHYYFMPTDAPWFSVGEASLFDHEATDAEVEAIYQAHLERYGPGGGGCN